MPTFLEFLTALAAIFLLFYLYVTRYVFTYFKRKGIPYLEPSFPLGNSQSLLRGEKTISLIFKDFYDQLKAKGARYGGYFMITKKSLMLVDPEVIRWILVKDFKHFVDRGTYVNEEDDPLSANMFNLEGQKWKAIRSKLSPTFTSGKMKYMFDTVVKCSEPFEEYLEGYVTGKNPVDIKTVFTSYTVDVIGSCAFGLDCNTFKDKDHKFLKYSFKAISKINPLKVLILMGIPSLAKKLHMRLTSKDVEEFFFDLIKKTVAFRRDTNTTRKDFMQLLLELLESNKVNINEMTSEALLFFNAGFETSSTTGTFCLYELAKNPEVQDRLREEVHEMLENNNGQVTYEGVQEMKYLAQVIDETLRKYPPLGFLNRMVVSDYKIPDTDIVLEKGFSILISTYSLQHDPEFYPEPDKFDPDRFSEENKRNIVPFTYMPFGDGPRNCIGMRFGIMQTKIGLIGLLRNHKYTLNSKTLTPLTFDAKRPLLSPVGGIWLNVEKV
nr:cytochrome P450 monooxygenase CYP6SZ1 [Lasioderma serricorne]